MEAFRRSNASAGDAPNLPPQSGLLSLSFMVPQFSQIESAQSCRSRISNLRSGLNFETRASSHVGTEIYNTVYIEPLVPTLVCWTIAFSGTAPYLLPHVRSRIAGT